MPKQVILRFLRGGNTKKLYIVNCNENGQIKGAGYLTEIFEIQGKQEVTICWSYNKTCGFIQHETKLIQ